MPKIKIHHIRGLRDKVTKTVSAHDAIANGIATHAQKHEARLESSRDAARHAASIQAGIDRGTSKLRCDHHECCHVGLWILDSNILRRPR